MNFNNVVLNIIRMVKAFFNVADQTYNMIVNNTLLLVFVLIFAIFVGLTLLKRLIHIN